MELIENFGLDPILLGAQIVNFLIILFILKKFLYKPILTTLEKRKATIKEGLDKTEEARIRLEKIAEKEKQILRIAQEQAKKILDEAKSESIGIIENSEQQSKIKADRMLRQAREQINLETRAVEKRLSLHVSSLAIDFLKKAVADLFSKKEQESVIKNVLKKVEQKSIQNSEKED